MTWAGRAERLGKLLPELTEIDKVFASTKAGDPMPLIKLAHKGLGVFHPGYADAAEEFSGGVLKAGNLLIGRLTGTVIDGEVLHVEPWRDLLGHIAAMKFGVVVILGAKGYGKTTLALKLADVWRKRTGYKVECCGVYPEDTPLWASRISMNRLTARARKVARYLNEEEGPGDDGLTEADFRKRTAKSTDKTAPAEPVDIDRMKHRVVVVDEAALFFSSLSAAGQQDSRESARNLNNQARHLESIFVFVCQNLSELPDYLQTSAVQFYKWAGEEAIKRDYKQGSKRDNRERWIEVLAALHAVRYGGTTLPIEKLDPRAQEAIRTAAACHRWYAPPWESIKCWSYCIAPDLGGHSVRTVVPNGPADMIGEAA